MDNFIIKQGQVIVVENESSTYNESSANRIKVRLPQDKDTPINDIPWAFPLLPKTIQSVPKEGEGVFVFLSELGNNKSNRYYLGPIISQPQYNDYCPYNNGKGPALAFIQGGNEGHKLRNITTNSLTNGAFPNANDISLIGRSSEDIILKDGEIDLRCGIRSEAINDDADKDIKGKIIFNSLNPAYIQLKYKNGVTTKQNQNADSLINIVADRINIISHKDENSFKLTNNKTLIDENEMDEIMSKLHQLPYGDILVEYLNILRAAIVNHGHNFGPGNPPIDYDAITLAKSLDFNKILSDKVRIS